MNIIQRPTHALEWSIDCAWRSELSSYRHLFLKQQFMHHLSRYERALQLPSTCFPLICSIYCIGYYKYIEYIWTFYQAYFFNPFLWMVNSRLKMGGFFYINKFLVDIVEKSYFTDRNRKLSALESKNLLVIITTDIVRKTQKTKNRMKKSSFFPFCFVQQT